MDILKEVLQGKRAHDDARFVEWLEESEEHQKRYEHALANAAQDLRVKQSFDRQGVWEKVMTGIERRGRRRTWMRVSMKYAAVVVPLVALVAWWMLRTGWNEDSGSLAVAANDSNIVLFLSNGEQVNISHMDSTGVQERNGMKIMMTGERDRLVYEQGDSASEELIYNTLSVPIRAEYCLTLADGTKVWLAATSKLRYPVNFVGDRREVYLEGEAFFDVAKNPEKPFVVHCEDFSVRALGTSFDVSCYGDDDYALATLASGKIEVTMGELQRVLHPGEQAVIQDNKLEVKEVNILPYTSWMEDRLYFFNEKLETIMKRMSRWYGMEVCYDAPGIKELHFTGNVPKYADINKVFDMLEFATHLKFTLQKGKVVISKVKE